MVSVGLGSNRPILPTIRSQMKANKVEVPVLTNEALGLDTGTIGKPGVKSLVVDAYARDCAVCKAEMLTGTPQEIARKIKELIDEEGEG